MTFTTQKLARLRADRAAALATMEPRDPVETGHRSALARKAGQAAAADLLTWPQVTAFRNLLPVAMGNPALWCGAWGTNRVRDVAGDAVADTTVFVAFEDWAAWLAGVDDVAQAVEAAA